MSSERVTFGQRDRADLLFGLGHASLVALGAAAGMALAGLVTDGLAGMAAALVVAGPLAGAALARWHARPVIEWVPIGLAWAWRRCAGQHRYLAGPRSRRVGELVLPGRAAHLGLVVGPGGVAVVEDRLAATVSVTAAVRAGPFLLAGSSAQEARVGGWGALLAELGQTPGLVRLQVLEKALADSADALVSHFQAHGKKDTQAAASYVSLVEGAGPAAERHEAYLTWTWDRRQLSRDIRRSGGGTEGLQAVISQRMGWVESLLRRAELRLSGWLSPRALASVIHSSYDPTWTPASPGGCDPAGAGPEAMEERWGDLRSDAGWHAAYRVAEWPRLAVGPDVLAPLLLAAGVRRAFTFLVEPVPPGRAERQIRAAKAGHVAESEAKARIRQVHSQRSEARLADVLRREADLVAGHVELRYLGLISVSAPDEAGLEAACVAIEQAARRAQLELRRCYGQQAQAFAATALPLGIGVLQGGRW